MQTGGHLHCSEVWIGMWVDLKAFVTKVFMRFTLRTMRFSDWYI